MDKESVIQSKVTAQQYQVRSLGELGDFLISKWHLGYYIYNYTTAIL